MTSVDSAGKHAVEGSDDLSNLIRKALAHYAEAFGFDYDPEDRTVRKPDFRACLLESLSCLERAAHLLPTEPWIWLKLGWLNHRLAVRGFSRDGTDSPLALAQSAYTRVLEIDPDNIVAHFLLAYLHLYDECPTLQQVFPDRNLETDAQMLVTRQALNNASLQVRTISKFPRPPAVPGRVSPPKGKEFRACYEVDPARMWEYVTKQEALAWDTTSGEHLRVLRDRGGVAALLSASSRIQGLEDELAYFGRDEDAEALSGALWKLGFTLPADRQARYFYSVGAAFAYRGWLPPRELGDYFAQASKSSNVPTWISVRARSYCAKCLLDDGEEPRTACDELLLAHKHLLEGEIDEDSYEAWIGVVGKLAWGWEPDAELSPFQTLWEAAADTQPAHAAVDADWFKPYFAAILDAAGRCSYVQGKYRRAEEHWLRAEEYDPSRIAVPWALARLYLEQERFRLSLQQQEQYVRLAPDDKDARHLLGVLREATRSGTTREELEEKYAELKAIALRTYETVEQIRLQADTAMTALAARQDGERRLREQGAEPETVYSDTVQRLHNLFIKGAQIQVLALSDTTEHLRSDPSAAFTNLLPECQNFLLTAEVFYRATQEIGQQVDCALISVEYSKVVETELKKGFIAGLAQYLDSVRFDGALEVLEPKPLGLRKKEKWVDLLGSHRFTLGKIRNLLSATLTEGRNAEVKRYISKVAPNPVWFESFLPALTAVTDKYRNGAAHTEPLERSTLDAFHKLLFNDGLLRRLVELRQRVEAQKG